MKNLNLDINPKLSLSGKWRVQVVDKNTNKSEYPLGKEFRDNTILNNGRHAIAGAVTPALGGLYSMKTCLADLMAGKAYVGTDATPAVATQTGIIGISFTSLQTTPQFVSTTSNLSNGRIFTTSWDFDAVLSDVNLWEACIESGNCTTNFIFSRFVFPAVVALEAGQFIRLEYALTVKMEAITTPIPISLTSGSFDGTGFFGPVGTFDNLFGAISGTGVVTVTRPASQYGRGCLPIHYAPGSSVTYAGACMVLSTINALDPVVFPAVGVGPNISLATGSTRITQADRAIPITYDSAGFTRSCKYTFIAGNPFATTNIGGIMFSSQETTYLQYGWLWAFNSLQSKDALKSISVILNQTVL